MIKSEFKSIVKNYSTVFFDAYGVLKNHHHIIEGVSETLDYLTEQKINYWIITNDASVSPKILADYYHNNGAPQITSDKIISSGFLTAEYIKRNIPNDKIILYLGRSSAEWYLNLTCLKSINLKSFNQEQINSIGAVALMDSIGLNLNTDITRMINILKRINVPLIIANQDNYYPLNKDEIEIAIGGIGSLIENILGIKAIRFGKPGKEIFDYALKKASEASRVSKKDILMVGDILETDILGANEFGIDSALVLSGSLTSDEFEKKISENNIFPTYVCNSISN